MIKNLIGLIAEWIMLCTRMFSIFIVTWLIVLPFALMLVALVKRPDIMIPTLIVAIPGILWLGRNIKKGK